MISDHDRSYYIGASDTKYVMGNWNTATFRHWWDIKMGFDEDYLDNIYLRTGTMYEPKILDALGVKDRDRQIIIGRLRVNLDGETDEHVYEIKTINEKQLKSDVWIPPVQYIDQAQVELFATQKDMAYLYAYVVNDRDYEAVEVGETLPIAEDRLVYKIIKRDDEWLEKLYLPRLWYLCGCLEREELPCMDTFVATQKS